MADAKKLIGGLGKIKEQLLAPSKELTAAERAEAGRKAAALIKSQPQVKASEALGQLMEKGFKKTTTTQADRTRVGGGNIGGAPFSAISEADPNYADKVWGVFNEGTANRLINLTSPDTAWTTMLGTEHQLKTNPIVFDKLRRGFVDSMKQGNLSDELAGKINHNLAITFGEGADIRDPKIWKQADTFEKRAALSNIMMGKGIPPSEGGVSLGGEKSGKGVIFRPSDILKRETEPYLLHTEHGGDVPTFAAGPRLFRLDKETEFRPDLHPGFPTLIKGKDLEYNMAPVPTEIYLPDWHAKFKKDNPNRKPPSYFDLALGVKGEGLPSQDLNDEYIRHLLREGNKDGGVVDIDAADARLASAIEKRMAKGGSVDIEAADARLEAAINARMGMKDGGGAFKRLEFTEEDSPVQVGLHANKQGDMSNSGVIANLDIKGAGRLGVGTNISSRGNEMNPATMLNYSNNVGNLGLNANVMKPSNARDDMLMTNVMASYPIGEGRVSAGMHGSRRDGTHQVNAHSLGYNAPVGGGNLNLNVTKPRQGSAMVGAQYQRPFAEGGQTEFKKLEFMADGGKLVKGGAKVMKKLFADEALPQVEREANLNKMLSESKVKDKLFHGTTKDVKSFDQSKAGKKTGNLTTALGTFLSDSPQEASRYAKDWGAEGGNVMPVFAQLKNPYEMPYSEFNDLAMGAWNRRMKDPDYDPKSVVKVGDTDAQRRAAEAVNKHESDALQDVMNRREELMSQGYDSVMVKIGGNNEIIVFDPTKIKSATGNRGTYDMTDLDINKAEGGGAFKKLEFMADGGKLVKGATNVMKKLLAPQDDALKLAQERAALPVSQGGLGLPANNTPEQRAKAMGFNTEGFHGTDAVKDFKKFKTSPNDETGIKGVSFALDPKETDAYVTGRWTHEGYGGRVIPVMVRGNAPEEYLNLFEQVINNAKTYPETNMGQDRMLKKALKDSDSIGIDYSKSIGGTEFSVLEPDRIRSRFAAFDPFRKDTATAAIMGVAAPDLLAKEKEKKKADGGKIVGGLGKIAKKLLEEPKIQTIEAPSIIIPSKLSNVKEAARKREGEYGARRVERASDEIPNLEKMYQEDALRSAFIGDNARALMTMNPADFENYAAPLKPSKHKPAYASLEDRIKSGELYKDDLPTDEYVNYLRSISGGFDAIPFLEINKGEQGLPLTPFISGHEGRHRNRALAGSGESTNLIQLLPRAELREPFPRRSQEEYIEALKKELAMTNNMVLPEKFDMPSLEELKQTAPEIYEWAKKNVKNNSVFDKKIQRSEIELPDIYAEGGAAFKTLQFKDAQHFDGGGIAFPEMTPMTEGSRREPLLTEKDWENIKRNAPEVYEWAKQNVKDEASQLKSARGVKDFALRTGAQYLGGIPDLLNLGLMGVDALADTNLSSEKPYFGSERYIDAMRKAGMVGENEFPIAETIAGVLMPAGLIKKGIKKISGAKPAKQEPKKRQGGLSAMAR